MKFRFEVVITLPDELFPPSPTAHPDSSRGRVYEGLQKGLERMIGAPGLLPCIGGGTSWTVSPRARRGRPPKVPV